MKERPFVILFLSLIASAVSLDVNTTSAFHFTLFALSNGVTVTPMILTWPIDRLSCDHCQYKSC